MERSLTNPYRSEQDDLRTLAGFAVGAWASPLITLQRVLLVAAGAHPASTGNST